MISKNNSGSALALALMISTVLVLIILSISKMQNERSHEKVYFAAKERAREFAETGLHVAIASMTRSSNPAFPITIPEVYNSTENVRYQTQISSIAPGVLTFGGSDPVYYFVTTATSTLGGKKFSTRLHSYARISNVGEYFAAVNGPLEISHGVQSEEGKIFATRIKFYIDSPVANTVTRIKSVEYTDDIIYPELNDEKTFWKLPNIGITTNVDPPKLQINPSPPHVSCSTCPNDGSPPFNFPRRLTVGLVFPQVISEDLINWKTIAYNNNTSPSDNECSFNINNPNADIPAPSNGKQIYYCPGDIRIQGKVDGQILFVAEKNIFIIGNLEKKIDDDAHQAILIAYQNVFISSTMVTASSMTPILQTVQAMVLAPNGGIIPLSYNNDNIHRGLRINFLGTWVVSQVSDFPNTFPNVYRYAGDPVNLPPRVYRYDQSFKDNPPPHIPAMSKIYYLFEEGGTNDGMW